MLSDRRSIRFLLWLGLASSLLAEPSLANHGGVGGGGGAHGVAHHVAPIHGGGAAPAHGGGAGSGVLGHPDGGNPGPININYNPGIYFGYGAAGAFYFSTPLVVVGQGGFPPFLGPNFGQQAVDFGWTLNPGNAGVGLRLPIPAPVPPTPVRARRPSPNRAKELVEIGDRSFRGNNIHRAEEKYNLAVKADPTSPIPHVHLAQVSIARGDYSAAADHLRNAVTVAKDGGWLVNAPDIQAVFGEPGDFAKQLARLETHLQASPNDRDAWFVLGAEIYLSGRAKRAYDVFQRLTDRRPDEALTAFLDASTPKPDAPK